MNKMKAKSLNKLKTDAPAINISGGFFICSPFNNYPWNNLNKKKKNKLYPREKFLNLPAYGGNCFCYHDNLSAWVYLPRDVDIL